jgi:DNA replication and repair protein RecF
MDRLFQEGASGRRRFLDRLVYALEPGHARTVAAHDTALAERRRLLGEGRWDAAWLAGLEEEMARHAVAATAARAGLVDQLNAALAGGIVGDFPVAQLTLICPIAGQLARMPALAVEDWLREAMAAARPRDAAAGNAQWGAQRADLDMADLSTGVAAAQASTGQQKALLIGVILGHAALLAGARGVAPLLLLDEPVVHLDQPRREALFTALSALPAQVFLTGTDRDVFAGLAGRATFWRTGGNALHADPSIPHNTPTSDG